MNLKYTSIFMIALFLLSFNNAPVVAEQGRNGEIRLNAAPDDGTPLFVSVSPESPQYGYPLHTVVNVTYLVLNTDVPKLMGQGNVLLDWTVGATMTKTAGNATHDWYSLELNLTGNTEFKGRNEPASANKWEAGGNHVLAVEGALATPELLNVTDGTFMSDLQDGRTLYYVEHNTNATIWASVVNGNKDTGDYYLVGEMTGWDITNRTWAMTYRGFDQLTAGTNMTYWSVEYNMTRVGRTQYKIGAFGDWAQSESGPGNHILTDSLLKVSKPTLMTVTGATEERARNDDSAVNEGAKFRAAIGDNVTFWYMVFSLDTCDAACQTEFNDVAQNTVMELQGDDAGKTLDWDVNQQLAMTYNNTYIANFTNIANVSTGAFTGYMNLTNVSVATYSVNYTVVVESAQFKGNFGGDWEGYDFSANNLLVAGIDWTSDIVGDVYNVGTFTIRFHAEHATENTANPDVLSFGIWNGADWSETNFTGSVGSPMANGTWIVDMTISAEDYTLVAGTEGNAQAILYHFDLGLQSYTKSYDPAGSHSFTPLDGSAGGTLDGDASQALAATMEWTATAGDNTTVSSASMDWGDNNTDTLTGTSGNATHTYTADGDYNVTLTVTTVAGGTFSVKKEITVDGTAPTVTLDTPTADGLVATFKFSFSDAGSGLKSAVIDFGDGKTTDVTTATSVNHEFSDAKSYTIKLTVTDNAGNSASASVTLDLTPPATTETSEGSSFLPGFTTMISIIGLGSLFVLRRKK